MCAEHGIEAHLVLRGEAPAVPTGYCLLSHMYGVAHHVSRAEYSDREALLQRWGAEVAGEGGLCWNLDELAGTRRGFESDRFRASSGSDVFRAESGPGGPARGESSERPQAQATEGGSSKGQGEESGEQSLPLGSGERRGSTVGDSPEGGRGGEDPSKGGISEGGIAEGGSGGRSSAEGCIAEGGTGGGGTANGRRVVIIGEGGASYLALSGTPLDSLAPLRHTLGLGCSNSLQLTPQWTLVAFPHITLPVASGFRFLGFGFRVFLNALLLLFLMALPLSLSLLRPLQASSVSFTGLRETIPSSERSPGTLSLTAEPGPRPLGVPSRFSLLGEEQCFPSLLPPQPLPLKPLAECYSTVLFCGPSHPQQDGIMAVLCAPGCQLLRCVHLHPFLKIWPQTCGT